MNNIPKLKPNEIYFDPEFITTFGIRSALAYLKQAANKVDEAKRNTILEEIDDVENLLLN